MSLRKCHVNFVQCVNIITSMAVGVSGTNQRAFHGYYACSYKSGLPFSGHRLLDRWFIVCIIMLTLMKRSKPDRNRDPKTEALREEGALHPNPEGVGDEAFRRNEFFDARDRVQVRYEMLRRHRVDQEAVTDVAAAFGVSRQAFYTTEAAFEERGVAGLLPRRRGPKRAHKCTDEILDFVEQWREASPEAGKKDVARVVQERFGVSMHPRSIDRALARHRKKKR